VKLPDANLKAGQHSFDWHMNSAEKKIIKSGAYLCVMQSPNYNNSVKIMIQ
jgi:hypothetical protein